MATIVAKSVLGRASNILENSETGQLLVSSKKIVNASKGRD